MSTRQRKNKGQRPATTRVKATQSAAVTGRVRSGSDHARTRLEHLYQISRLLSDFEGLEPTVSAVLAIATRTLPALSALLIEATEDRLRMVIWKSEGHSDALLTRAKTHIRTAYNYLAGGSSPRVLDLQEQSEPEDVLGRQASVTRRSKSPSKFIVIPLAVGRRPLFGAMQLEVPASLEKADLIFVNAIINQLAIALDRHHAWQRDIALRERAEEAIRMRDRILSVVSHDLKSPLGAILATADTLAMAKSPEAVQPFHSRSVARIQRAALRMQRLIGDLLDFVSIQAGQLAIARRPTEAAFLVNEAMAAFEAVAREKELHLESEIGGALGKVYADTDRILQVFSNLISNAVAATPPGGSILLRAEERPHEIVFTVSDTGPGIASEDVDNIFERHWRGSESGYKGTGLGLSIAKGIIEAHGGRIGVEGKAAPGATLFFAIPLFDFDRLRVDVPASINRADRTDSSLVAVSPARAQLDLADVKRVEGAQRFISELTASLTSSLDYSTMLEKVARAVVPEMADWCVVDLINAEGKLRHTAVAHANPEKEELARKLGRRLDAKAELTQGVSYVARTGRSEIYPEIADIDWAAEALGVEHREFLRELGTLSYMCVTLRARGRVLGILSFVRGLPVRRYTAGDLVVAEEVGRRAGMAIDNARLYAEAEEAVRVRDEFMSLASHELKTPLTPLQLDLELLLRIAREPPVDQRLLRPLETAYRQTHRLNRLVENLLDVSRLTSGHLALQLEVFDLVSMTREVLNRFRLEATVAGCELELCAAGPVSGGWDRMRFEQILSNLLSNAIKYGSGKPIEITVEDREGMARLSVEDHGIGISRQDTDRIFDRFERAVSPRNYGGLGLGLYVARKMAEAHGGTIVVRSQPGAGAKFTAILPMQCANAVRQQERSGHGVEEHPHRG